MASKPFYKVNGPRMTVLDDRAIAAIPPSAA
jgi:hypothetical protein